MRSLLHHLRQVPLPLLLVATACATGYDTTNRKLGVLPIPAPVPVWMGPVAPAATPQLRGAAAVLPNAGARSAQVLVSLWNATPGQRYGWTLHAGSCGAVGAPTGASGVLATYPDGSARAEAFLPGTLAGSTPYAVVITPSPGTDTTQPSACADLTVQQLVLDTSRM